MKTRAFFLTVLILTGFMAIPSWAEPTVYIPLGSGNQVIAVDATTDKIIASYPGVINAHGLVATPDGEYLIAGSLNETPLKKDEPEDTPTSKLYLIHPEHGHVISTIPVSGGTHHQAITPDGRYVLSTHTLKGYVSVLDLKANKITRTIKTGAIPNYTFITRDGKRAFVSNSGANAISEIDLSTWQVKRTLESGPAPSHMVFSKNESTLFVINPRAGTVSAISIKSGKVTKTYTIGKDVHGLDISDDGQTLFVSTKKEHKLIAINTATGKKRELALSPAPYHLNTIRGMGKVYVSSRKRPLIWVVDVKSLKVLGKIPLPGGEGHQMAIVQ